MLHLHTNKRQRQPSLHRSALGIYLCLERFPRRHTDTYKRNCANVYQVVYFKFCTLVRGSEGKKKKSWLYKRILGWEGETIITKCPGKEIKRMRWCLAGQETHISKNVLFLRPIFAFFRRCLQSVISFSLCVHPQSSAGSLSYEIHRSAENPIGTKRGKKN